MLSCCLLSVELLQHVHRTQPNNNLKQLLGNNGMTGSGNAFGAGMTRKPAFMGHARGKLNAAILLMYTHAVNAAILFMHTMRSMQQYR